MNQFLRSQSKFSDFSPNCVIQQDASNTTCNMAPRVTNGRLGLKQYCQETNSSQKPVKPLEIPMCQYVNIEASPFPQVQSIF